jgi:hypothetical protein
MPAAERLGVPAAAGLFLYLALFRDGDPVYPFHKASTGAWIDEGVRVAAGEWPYRDFSDRIGPALPLLNGALVAVFGDGLAVHVFAGWAIGCALVAALHALCGAVARARWRLLPPAALATLVYPPYDLGSHKWPALLLVLVAVLALLRGGAMGAAAAGAACGTAAAFTPGLGLAAIAGSAWHLWREGERRLLGTFLSASVSTVALIAASLAAAVGARPVAEGWSSALADPMRTFDPGRFTPAHAAFVLLAVSALAAGIAILREPSAARGERLVARCGLAVFLTVALGHVDPYAVAVHATVLTAAMAAAARRGGSGAGTWVQRAATATLLACIVIGAASLVAWRQRLQPLVRQTFRAGAAWIGAPNEELPWLESETRPGDPTFVFPAGGGSYLLTRTRNATSLPYAIEGLVSEEAQRRALREIEAARPRAGVWMGGQRFVPAAGRPRLDILHDGILRSYSAERVLPDGTLLLRRKD